MNIGKTIRGYTLTNWLGSGGMGEVYQAVHQTTRRQAAVKVLYSHTQTARFRNEAYIQASVQHPHIAVLYEFAMEDNSPCIIMEYVEGISMEKLLKHQTRLPESFAWKVMQQIAAAVVYLHERNIIHRDLKPGNIKVNKEGTAKLLDFGIAKSAYSPKLTREGFIVGTAHYMAPEQFQSKVSIAADCWGLGVLLYEMLTGYLPFDGVTETEVRIKIEKGQYTPPDLLIPGISKRSRMIISRLLRANPENRMTAKQLLEALRNAGNDEPDSFGQMIKNWWDDLRNRFEGYPIKRKLQQSIRFCSNKLKALQNKNI